MMAVRDARSPRAVVRAGEGRARWSTAVARGRTGAAWLSLALWIVSCSGDAARPRIARPAVAEPVSRYRAMVRRTAYGVPHIAAHDLASLGYGLGYAVAEDDVCLLAEEILTVRGQRARYFGDAPYDAGTTRARRNVESDAVHRMLGGLEVVERARAALDEPDRGLVRGYAAGVSRYVRELQRGAHPGRHAACREQPWLRPIDDADLYLRMHKLALLASSASLIDAIAAAQPPSATAAASESASMHRQVARAASAPTDAHTALGSNMYAFGRALTGGAGIVLGNPHFPWSGPERLHQVHLTISGKLDVQGASIVGVPAVVIGFNDTLAWSHTVSTAHRFTLYALTLKRGDPLTYLTDGQERKIIGRDFDIEVLQGDGSRRSERVRLYRSEYGPMLSLGPSELGWTDARALTMRDANADNTQLLRQYLRWNRARSLDELVRIQHDEVGLPWLNTAAADRDGEVYYADVGAVPNLPDTLARTCAVPRLARVLARSRPGLPLLDGSRGACDWRSDADAPRPGIFGPAHLPWFRRQDLAINCNDSHWLANPSAPLTGFASILGRERGEQSLRTRLCHQQVRDRTEGRDGHAGTGVTLDALAQIALAGRVFSAERYKEALIQAQCGVKERWLTHGPPAAEPPGRRVRVPIAAACTALRAWDGRVRPDSQGSLVWDELWPRVEALREAGVRVYDVPFDPRDPLGTPRALRVGSPPIGRAFAAAVDAVARAGFAPDAPRSAFLYREGRGGASDRIPVIGGAQRAGSFAIAQTSAPALAPDTGYGNVTFGNSYLQLVGFTPDGVDARTLVTYGQSSDPASPHFDDYSRLYAEGKWLRAAFTEAQIAADVRSTLMLRE